MPFEGTQGYREPQGVDAQMPRPAVGVTSGGNKPWRVLLDRLRDSVKTGDSDEVLRAFTEYIPAANRETRGQVQAALARAKATAEGHATADKRQIADRVAVQEGTVAEPLRASLGNRYDEPTRAYIVDTLNNADSLRHQREMATQESVRKALTSAAESARGKSFSEMFAQAKQQVQGKGK